MLRADELLTLAQVLFRAECAVLTLFAHNSSPVVACVGSREGCAPNLSKTLETWSIRLGLLCATQWV